MDKGKPGGFSFRSDVAVIVAIKTVGACTVTAAGFFAPGVMLWLTGLPMLVAIVTGRRAHRAIAMAAFMLWPAILCAIGLVAIGFHPVPVWAVAVIVVIALAWLSSLTGVAVPAVIVTLIPVFPASPLLVLADAVPGTGLIGASALAGPVAVMVCLAIIEFMPGKRVADVVHRASALAMITIGVFVPKMTLKIIY